MNSKTRAVSKSIFLSCAILFFATAFSGTAQAGATFTIVNNDDPGEGFNDGSAPDAASTAGGNTGATLGEQRLQAFQFAADIWGGVLDSPVETRIEALMDPLSCGSTGAVLGLAGPKRFHRDFTGALEASTWYPSALANKLAGMDLNLTTDEIRARFNSSIGTTCAFPKVWYYGLDANGPAGTNDFITVVMHEIGHGLGFTSLVERSTGIKEGGYNDTYMLNLEDHSTGKLYPDMTNAERVAAAINTDNLHWVGPAVVAGGAVLTDGRSQPTGHVEMHATDPLGGSSVHHFSTALTPNELMEPSYTGTIHNPGLTRNLMADIGWSAGDPVDLYFVVDLSGSFGDDLSVFKSEAPLIIAQLIAEGNDLKVGLGSFQDYPIDPFGDASFGDVAYRQDIDLTSNIAAVLAIIDGLSVISGAGLDGPESQLPALFQAATGAGQDLSGAGYPGASIPAGQQANFRDGAVKLFLLWTDAPFHRSGDPGDIPYPGPSFDDTVDAILALDPPQVIGVASGGNMAAIEDLKAISAATNAIAPEGGVDCDEDGVIDIAEGDPIVCTTAITGAGVGMAMLAVIEAALAPTTVEIDVRSSINLRGSTIPVGILTTDSFDALDVDSATVCFGPVLSPGIGDCTESHGKGHPEDVNLDGRIDLRFHFDTAETGLAFGDVQGCVTGKTFEGRGIEGCSMISTLQPKGRKK
jgi:hypothetical protein